jgi:hypothetical protein
VLRAYNPSPEGGDTMTEKKHSSRLAEVKALLANEPDGMM